VDEAERVVLIEEAVSPVVGDHGLELGDLEWRGLRPRGVLRLFVDKPGGIEVGDCERLSREIGDVLADAIDKANSFIWAFTVVYTLVIFAYILTSWIRMPYSPWLNRLQRFLYDVSEPYLRLFRRILPSMGPLDLSPWVATIVLWLVAGILMRVLNQFH